MWDRGCAGAAIRSDLSESPPKSYWGFVLVAFAFVALVGAELALIISIPGGNYGGADGKAAQAEILATLEFARAFDISNLNPLQGMGSQMMPMNVWVNPAYWPFAVFDKELATEISGVVALVCYAVACYVMARCFDLPRLPSVVAAQLSIMLFVPAALAVAIYCPYRISGPPAAPAAASICIGSFLVEVCAIFLLGMCAWLGARNLAAAWSSMDSHPRCSSQCRFIICLYGGLFVFERQLVATSASLPRACSLRTLLDCGGRRLLGRVGSAGSARSRVDI